MAINVMLRRRVGIQEKGCAVCGRCHKPLEPYMIYSYFDVTFSDYDSPWHDRIELCWECVEEWVTSIYGDSIEVEVGNWRRGQKRSLALPDIDDYKRLLIWCRAGQ